MGKISSGVLSWSLIAGLLICLVILVRQNLLVAELVQAQEKQLSQLTNEVSSLQNRSQAQEELAGRLGEEADSLRNQLTALIRNIARLERASNIEDGITALSTSLSLLLLEPGIYVLAPGGIDAERNAEEDEYTIYHIMMSVGVGDFEQDLQFGVARSGLFSWQFYFDYNNDGQVDTDMMYEFVDSIPFGSYVSGVLDPDFSQSVYDRFLKSFGEAKYTPPDRIGEQSSEIAIQSWGFVTSSSEQLAGWIKNRLETEMPAEPSQQ